VSTGQASAWVIALFFESSSSQVGTGFTTARESETDETDETDSQ
jgi:hypothetical protein